MRRILFICLLTFLDLAAEAVSVTISVQKQPVCSYGNGILRANASGGTGPYSYAWSNGGSSQSIGNLPPGDYSVTVTDANMDQAMANLSLMATDYGDVLVASTGDWFNYGNGLCSGSVLIGFDPVQLELAGPPPYYVDGVALQEGMYEDPSAPGQYVTYYGGYLDNPQYGSWNLLSFADGNGCPGTYNVPIGWPVQWPTLSTVNIQGACVGTTSGSITISSTGEGHQQPVQTRFEPPVPGYYPTGGGPSTFTITGLAAGSYTMTQFMSESSFLPSSQCSSTFNFTIPQLGPECGTVSGTVFIDNDQDCVQDAGEVGVPNLVLEVQPGPQYIFTNAAGAFNMQLTNGSYTLGQGNSSLVQLCPSTPPAPFTLNFNPVVLNIADSSTVALDLGTHVEATAMRPGFPGTYWGRVRNLSPQVSGAATVTLVLDPALTYDGATPTPTDVTGNTITWQPGSFGPYQSMDFSVDMQVPAATPLGSVLGGTLTVENTLSDAEPANNTANLDRTVTGSFDPNDKLGYTNATRSGSQFFLGEDEWIEYTIRFQNTGTDTAFTVVVRDGLSEDLAIGTLEILGASHAFVPSFGEGRELVFTFNDILLPDSTTDLLGSQGFVSFRIRPAAGIQVGDVIENTAGIYFDFNDPVITNTVTHVVEVGTGVAEVPAGRPLRLAPNPADDVLLVLDADGADAAVRVYAIDGRPVDVEGKRTAQGLELQVGTLAPGTYLIRTSTGAARFVKH